MNKGEKYLELMCCVLQADGNVGEEEKNLFNAMVSGIGLDEKMESKYRAIMNGECNFDIGASLERIANDNDVDSIMSMVRDAFVLADADGIDDSEVKVIFEFLRKSGISEDKFDAIKAWAIENVVLLHRGMLLFEKD